MTTTDHSPIMEQRLAEIATSTAVKIEEFCTEAWKQYPVNAYSLPFSADNNMTFFIARAIMDLDKTKYTQYNAICAPVCQKLSKNFRWNLSKALDGYRTFTPVLFPGEEIETVTLFIKIIVPKDKILREKWLQEDQITKEKSDYLFKEELQDSFYVPLKTLKNPGKTFSFYGDAPLLVATMPYFSLSLEVTLRNGQKHPVDRIMLVESFMYFHKLRENLFSLHDMVIYGRVQSKEESTKKDDIAKVLEEMHNCPECGETAHIRCNCQHRDSTCNNGHKWHYDNKNNRILPGHGH
jgi:predicted RNA-binding Zn-ribbon protein involved in translation (DUF1610 family)